MSNSHDSVLLNVDFLMEDNTEMARELQDIATTAPMDPHQIRIMKAR
jgi:hypothetical protein